jgi:type IV secretion system protein VirD4
MKQTIIKALGGIILGTVCLSLLFIGWGERSATSFDLSLIELLIRRISILPPVVWLLLVSSGALYLFLSIAAQSHRSTVHGSARLATRGEVLRTYHHRSHPIWARLFKRQQSQKSLFVLGRYKGISVKLSERQQESNILLTAPVGSGKSSCVIIPNLLREQGHRSLFIADLKGELYHLTAGALAQRLRIWLLAPTQTAISQHYNPLAHIHTVEDAQDFAECWISNTGEHQDRYWSNTARLLISAVVLHLRATQRSAPFSRLADIFTTMSFEQLKTMLIVSPSSAARQATGGFLEHLAFNERLVGSIMTDIGNRFQLLSSQDIRQVTATNEIDFQQMVHDPTALYLSVPRHSTKRLQPLLACLTMQMVTTWERYAEQQPTGALPRSIACYFDEFTNIGSIPGCAELISSARSRRIAIIMAIQSFSQLTARYGEADAETIKSNAVTHLLLPGAGLQETCYYSERIGDTTVPTQTLATNAEPGNHHPLRTQGETRRRVLTPEELRTLPENTMLMVSKSSFPVLVKTKPYFRDALLSRLVRMEPSPQAGKEVLERGDKQDTQRRAIAPDNKERQAQVSYFLD